MDHVTHALSGIVCAQTLPKEIRPRWMGGWAALVAMSPDVDVFFSRTPVQYIEWHRGFSHSFTGIALLAVFWAAMLLWGLSKEKPLAHAGAARHGWTFPQAWLLAYVLLLLHVWLDVVTSYGTQVLLPFSDWRARFSGLFIIDPLTVLPLAVGVLGWVGNRRVMAGLLVWVLLWPAAACASRLWLEDRFQAELPPVIQGEAVTGVQLVPDAFAPWYWKLVLDTGQDWLVASPVTAAQAFGNAPKTFETYPKPPQALWTKLQAENTEFRAYARFAQFPYLEESYRLAQLPQGMTEGRRLPLNDEAAPYRVDMFSDLRFGSGLGFVRVIQGTEKSDEEKTFRIAALFDDKNRLLAVRFRVVRGAGGDSGWVPVLQ